MEQEAAGILILLLASWCGSLEVFRGPALARLHLRDHRVNPPSSDFASAWFLAALLIHAHALDSRRIVIAGASSWLGRNESLEESRFAASDFRWLMRNRRWKPTGRANPP
jgi:hypothetical protein